MLRLSRPVRLLSFAFAAAAALGCGSVATESTAAPPEALADGGVTLDAPVPVRPPRCDR